VSVHHYMSLIGPVRAIVRVPYPMPRWRGILKALTPVMHAHGYRAKDLWSLDGLLPYPNDPDEHWNENDRKFQHRLQRMFEDRDPTILPEFELYDWNDGEFVLVRGASAK
jgi:hypothetical protein